MSGTFGFPVGDDDELLVVVQPEHVAFADQVAADLAARCGRKARVVTSELAPADQFLLVDVGALRRLTEPAARPWLPFAGGGQCDTNRALQARPLTPVSYDPHCDGCADLGAPCADHQEPAC